MIDDNNRPLPSTPTNSQAGSTERVEIYRLRWANGESLWHPADNPEVMAEGRRLRSLGYQAGIREIKQ